ncbi:hypothetical protein NE237_028110 [Protea cynaroides]|uniref:PITH domain-containing protein n=1 Tax=Protea cynaroides TaxID=273540 RepID=A0A9Q0GRD8_9MAGN|nr:hypothetical protein NE237_028110 [Protea cynaroides]
MIWIRCILVEGFAYFAGDFPIFSIMHGNITLIKSTTKKNPYPLNKSSPLKVGRMLHRSETRFGSSGKYERGRKEKPVQTCMKREKQLVSRNSCVDYLESNEGDPELLVFILFTSDVKIKSISVVGGADEMSPSKMFINRDGIDFSNAQGMQPVQEWDLVENLQGVLEYQTSFSYFASGSLGCLKSLCPSHHFLLVSFPSNPYIGAHVVINPKLSALALQLHFQSTGSGDTDTSKVLGADTNGYITGAIG